MALQYLKNTEVNIDNVLIMTGNFNIRDCLWDPSYLFHSSHKDTLFEIADSFHVALLKFSPLDTPTIPRIQFWTLCFYIPIQQSTAIITFTWNGDLCLIMLPLLLIFIFMKNEFKQENNLYPRTVKKKLASSKNLSTPSRDSLL